MEHFRCGATVDFFSPPGAEYEFMSSNLPPAVGCGPGPPQAPHPDDSGYLGRSLMVSISGRKAALHGPDREPFIQWDRLGRD